MKSKPSSVEFHQEKKNKNLGGFMEPNVLRIHHNEEPYVEGRTESGKKKNFLYVVLRIHEHRVVP